MNKRVMMIGAHPDDCDFLSGGIALKYADAGYEVMFLSLCNGCGGHMTMTPAQTAERRYLETQRVARYAGIYYDVWRDVPDCELEASLELRRRLVRQIRAFAPELVICHRPNDYHADHRAASILVQDASYLLTVPNYCTDVPPMYRMPVIMYFSDKFQNPPFRPDIVVSIDDVEERKFRIWDCHVSQIYEWLPYEQGVLKNVPADPEERLAWLHEPRIPRDRILSAEEIQRLGMRSSGETRDAYKASKYRDDLVKRYGEAGKTVLFAEAFSVCEYGRQPDETFYNDYFWF